MLSIWSWNVLFIRRISRANCAAIPSGRRGCQLFCALYYLRHSPPYELLAFYFDISTALAYTYVHRVITALHQQLTQTEDITMPNDITLNQQALPCRAKTEDVGPVAASVDGFIIRTAAPTQREGWETSPLYLKRMKAHAFNILLIVLMAGTIIFLSDALPAGKYTDQAIWNKYNLRDRFVEKPYGIVADKGFTLNPANLSKTRKIKGGNLLKRPKGGVLSAQQELVNDAIKKRRLVVENTIAQLRKWGIVHGRYRCKNPEDPASAQFLSQCVRIVSILVNRRIRLKPLRQTKNTPLS